MMIVCTVCGLEKRGDDFFYRNRKTKKLHTQCKSCYTKKRQETWRIYYHKHGSKYRQRAVQRNKKIKDATREKLLEYLLGKSCVICGIKDIRVLEFDHINPTIKLFGISQAITSTRCWESILSEINKCQILCANCHKIKTSGQQNWYKNLPSTPVPTPKELF